MGPVPKLRGRSWGARAACAIFLSVVISGCGRATIPARIVSALSSGQATIYHIPPGSESWLSHSVILTIYGRGFGIAPILGRLGFDSSFADLRTQVRPYTTGIRRNDGGRKVIIAVHLIYGLAMPCSDEPTCVLNLDSTGVNIVKQYIKPAARLHWLVFLDSQLGTSSPATVVKQLIRLGYLKYDNVEVAIDPEFHLSIPYSPSLEPGLAFGSVTAEEINAAQRLLNGYVARSHLPHKKILLVHEFQMPMIQQRWRILYNLRNVQVVINADGLGPPGLKVETYQTLLGPQYHYGVKYRGIKLFLENPQVDAQHTDIPRMLWKQVFGRQPVLFGGREYRIHPAPNVVIIA